MNYCVYFHINKVTDVIFYVGIGNSKRPYSKRSRSDFWKNIVAKYGYTIKIFHENLSFENACQLEVEYISKFGRLDNGTGILVNLTNGGEGSDGYLHTEETKIKIKEHWSKYRGFDIEDIVLYNRNYNREYAKKYRENEEVKLKYQQDARDKYHNISDIDKENYRLKKKIYRDGLSDEKKSLNKEYQRVYKKNMSEEQKERQRVKNRERMRKKRLEKKINDNEKRM
jgi:hypothetical protein